MLEAAESTDTALPGTMQRGFPLVGALPRVGLGPPIDARPSISPSELRAQRESLNAATMRRVANEQEMEPDVLRAFESKAEEDVAAGRAAWVGLDLHSQLIIPRFPVDEGWKNVPGKPPERKARECCASG